MAVARRLALESRRSLLYVWLPVLLGVLWWELPSPSSTFFPPLWVICDAFRAQWFGSQARTDLVPSLEQLLVGFAGAVVVGVVLAFVLASIPTLHDLSLPLMNFFRGLPSPVIVPPLLLVFGLGSGFKIGVIILAALWPVLLNAYDAFCSLDEVQRETASSYRLSRWQRLTRVTLPAAGPQIVAGARNALQISILVMVVSEMLAGNAGIGYVISVAQTDFTTAGLWAAMLLVAVLGIVLNLLFVVCERRLLAWHRGMRAVEAQA